MTFKNASTSRQSIKQTLISLFLENDSDKIRSYCTSLSDENWTAPLFSLLYSQDPRIKWPAISCMGERVAHLAENNIEGARILLRRLIWNLNDESGGIGWGSPEVMGEILAQSPIMAREYHRILISYVNPCGNYLELPLLRQGAVWGIGRAAQIHPNFFTAAIDFLQLDLQSPLPSLKGHAIWALGFLPVRDKTFLLSPFLNNVETVTLYQHHQLATLSIGDIARQALSL